MSKGRNEEFTSLLSDESVHEEGDDEEEGFVDDDGVDEDNISSNAKKSNNDTLTYTLSISKRLSVVVISIVFLFVFLLLMGFHHSTEFPQQKASEEATKATSMISEEKKNDQQLQQQHNQVNDGSSASSASSPLAGSPTTTTSATTITTTTSTTPPTTRSKAVVITQTPTSTPSASAATLAITPSPSTATVTASTSQTSVASKPDIIPADIMKEEKTAKKIEINKPVATITKDKKTIPLEKAKKPDAKKIKEKTKIPVKKAVDGVSVDGLSLMSGLKGSNRYQRVCSPVGRTTELCMTLRYPFPVPQEVPLNGPNLRHVDERFFQLTGLVIVDNAKLKPYRDLVATEDEVRACLDSTATDLANANTEVSPFGKGEPSVAVAVFTRRKRGKTDFEFFGTRSEEQLRRVGQFFEPGHKLIIFGDSNVVVGSISSCTSQLFETCPRAPKFPNELRMYCDSPAAKNDPQQRHRRDGFTPFEGNLDHSKVFLTKLAFQSLKFNYKEKLMQQLTAMKDPNAKSLETASLLVQYPIAHISREKDLLNFGKILNDTKPFIAGLVDFQSPSTQAEFAKIGWKLTHMFAFDGLTQHFPSETGAYADTGSCREGQSCDAVPDWKSKKHGPLNCRGPLPNGSPFRKFIDEERSAFQNNGFDMRWYGQTWDFTNLFWWQHRAWKGKGGALDCTHYTTNAGGVCMYKYFLQAMIDDSLE